MDTDRFYRPLNDLKRQLGSSRQVVTHVVVGAGVAILVAAAVRGDRNKAVISDQPEQHVETLELINQEVTGSLAQQADSVTSIDKKATILVGYAGAASAFLATQSAQPVLAALAYVAYGAAVGFGIWAYAVSPYHAIPDPDGLFSGYWKRPKAETLAALVTGRVKAYGDNVPIQKKKARLWWVSLLALTAGVVLMIPAVLKGH